MKHDFIRDREQLAPWTSWLATACPRCKVHLCTAHKDKRVSATLACALLQTKSSFLFFYKSSILLQIFNASTLFLFFHSLTFPAPVPVWLKQRPGSAANRSCPEVSGTHFSAPLQSAKITDVSLTERHSPDALATRPQNTVLLPCRVRSPAGPYTYQQSAVVSTTSRQQLEHIPFGHGFHAWKQTRVGNAHFFGTTTSNRNR